MSGPRALAPPDVPERRVYVNASLRFDAIRAVGFDMDYTLAVYSPSELEALIFGLAVAALKDLGLPNVIRKLAYRPLRAIRGLVVDRLHGNVLKMDRYQHVSLARHGVWELDPEEKRRLYSNRSIPLDTPRYTSVDTLYALPEVDLYTQLVALREAHPGHFSGISYARLWGVVRDSIEACHRGGLMKSRILGDLPRYLEKDPDLPLALRSLAAQGKKLFLATNSDYEYTDAVMTYLLDDALGEGERWTTYFDDIVVSAGKPRYFTRKGASKVVGAGPRRDGGIQKVRAGGNFRELHRRLRCKGDAVLFVGDHIHGDVIRSKRTGYWRTLMVVPELEDELAALRQSSRPRRTFDRVLRRLEDEDARVSALASELAALQAAGDARGAGRAARKLTRLDEKRAGMQVRLEDLEREIDLSVHPHWGALMNDGCEVSRFGQQVQDYADLYTSRATNLARYPVGKYFQAPWEGLPHLR